MKKGLTPLFDASPLFSRLYDSGRLDSNQRPLDPQSSALTKLRYAPQQSSDKTASAGMADQVR